MKYLAAALAILLLVLAPLQVVIEAAPVLPWKTFSEAVPDATGNAFSMCPVTSGIEEVYVQRYEKDGNAYQFWFSSTTSMIVLAVYEGNAGAPTAVGVGKVDSEKRDEFPVMQWMSVEEARQRYPGGPCSALFPAQA